MRYRTIVCDPPWEYEEGFAFKTGDIFSHQDLPYPSMSLEEIIALPTRAMTDPKGCALFLWATNRFLEDAFDVTRCWGFRYRQTIVWRKTNPQPVGGSVAPNSEFLLVARRGPHTWHGPRWPESVIDAPRTTHSAKPEAFMDLVESISPPPVSRNVQPTRSPWMGHLGQRSPQPCRDGVVKPPLRFSQNPCIAASQGAEQTRTAVCDLTAANHKRHKA